MRVKYMRKIYFLRIYLVSIVCSRHLIELYFNIKITKDWKRIEDLTQ